MGIGLLLLAITGDANDLVILLSGGIFLSTLFLVILSIFIISSQKRIKTFVGWLPKFIDKLVVFIRYKSKKSLINIQRLEHGLEGIHRIYVKISKNWSVLRKPFFYALLINIFELATIYIVFLSFGGCC